MQVSRSQLRKIILREVKSLLEDSQSYDPGSGHGTYTFSYEKTGNKIKVHLITHNGKPIAKEFLGDQAGYFTDSRGLKIAKNMFKNDKPGITIVYDI